MKKLGDLLNNMENTDEKYLDSGEAHAYTPGLKVKEYTIIKKIKKLPVPGQVLVKKGEKINFDTIVAETYVHGAPHFVQVASSLNVEPHEIPQFMLKKEGEKVLKNEPIAEIKLLFGLIKNRSKSTIDGYIESISPETGRVTLREPDIPVKIVSNIEGRVEEILPNEGAIIKSSGAFIQGIFGIGGETNGELLILDDNGKNKTKHNIVLPEYKEKILAFRSTINKQILDMAKDSGVFGIIAGGIEYDELTKFLGEEIGVAITGEEQFGITVLITEGFGQITMSDRTWNILNELNGKRVSIDGTTQIRAGVIRPEVICPKEEIQDLSEKNDELSLGMKPGTSIRIIQSPYFGKIGKIISLPIDLKKVETESDVRVIEVEIENNKKVIIPRANVEIIEE
jgi:hypothetical protein